MAPNLLAHTEVHWCNLAEFLQNFIGPPSSFMSLVASLLLVAVPGFLVVMPGAPSSFLFLAKDRQKKEVNLRRLHLVGS